MLLINGNELELKGNIEDGTPEEQFIKGKIKDLGKEFKDRFPMAITFSENLKFKRTITTNFVRSTNVEGYPELRMMPFTSTITLLNQKIAIQYASNVRISKDGIHTYTPKKYNFKGRLVIDKFDIDLAFYVLYCLGSLTGGKEDTNIVKLEKPKDGIYSFAFIDELQVNEDLLYSEKIKGEVNNLILNELSDKNIKSIAILENIAKATDKPSNVLRTDLIKLIAVKQGIAKSYENAYADFKTRYGSFVDTNRGISLEEKIRLLIIDGKKAGVLKEINGEKFKRWEFWNPERKCKAGKICDKMPNKTFIDSLVDYLLIDETSLETLEKLVIGEKEKGEG